MSGTTISFHCGCGAKLKAGLSKSGQSLPCPKCGAIVTVPGGPPQIPTAVAPALSPQRGEILSASPAPVAATRETIEQVLYDAHPAMFRSQPLQYVLGVALCLVVIGLPVMLFWWLKNKGTRLTVTDRRTTLRRGILSKQITEVWHRDVRNVQLSQTLFQRIYGVGRLGISSSGSDGMEIDADGIPHPEKAKEIIDQHRGK